MKTKFLTLLLILGIGISTSCDNDEIEIPQEKTVNGTWNLINVRGGLASSNISYSNGDVRWTFNEMDSTLSVQNQIGNDKSFMLHSGSYSFDIKQNDETQILFVDKEDYRMVILSVENNLIITDDLNDGYTAEFRR